MKSAAAGMRSSGQRQATNRLSGARTAPKRRSRGAAPGSRQAKRARVFNLVVVGSSPTLGGISNTSRACLEQGSDRLGDRLTDGEGRPETGDDGDMLPLLVVDSPSHQIHLRRVRVRAPPVTPHTRRLPTWQARNARAPPACAARARVPACAGCACARRPPAHARAARAPPTRMARARAPRTSAARLRHVRAGLRRARSHAREPQACARELSLPVRARARLRRALCPASARGLHRARARTTPGESGTKQVSEAPSPTPRSCAGTSRSDNAHARAQGVRAAPRARHLFRSGPRLASPKASDVRPVDGQCAGAGAPGPTGGVARAGAPSAALAMRRGPAEESVAPGGGRRGAPLPRSGSCGAGPPWRRRRAHDADEGGMATPLR